MRVCIATLSTFSCSSQMLLIFADQTDCRWEFPAPLQPVFFENGQWRPEWFSAEQRHNQPQAVVAGPSPMAAVPLSLKDTIFPRFLAWKEGDYAFDGQGYVWDSQKGEQLTRSPHWIIWKLSADLP